jgi:hypothetical protein
MLRSSVRSALTAPEEGSTDSSLNSLRNIQEDQSSTLHDGYQIITQESQTDQRLSSLTVGEPHRSSLFLPSTTTANAMRLSITPSTTSSIGIEKPKENFFTKKNVVFFFKHNWVLLFYSLISLMVILVLFHLSFFAAKMHDDGNEFEPEFLGCRSWAYGTNCGLNGFDCQPFETTWMAFRCPTRCAWDQATSLAVYGTGKYRADSRICRAAIHAGVIGQNGGCALMRYSGEADSFVGTFTNGVRSRDFPSWFPKTYEFKEAPSIYCTDLSFVILSFGFISLIGYAVLPHTNPQALYLLLMAWGFFYVRLIGQPRSVNYQDIAMDSFGEIFVLLATCYCVYYMAPVYTFSIWSNHRTKKQRLLYWGLYYVVPFHLVLHMNYVAFIPWLVSNFSRFLGLSVLIDGWMDECIVEH